MGQPIEALLIPGTKDTPNINFDPSNGLFEVSGRSFPLNAKGFYAPVVAWLDEYSANPLPKTIFSFKLEYFNTPSSKSITDILKILKNIKDSGFQLSILWYYEEDDVDILDLGHVFSRIADLPFEFRDSN
jgi:hypothetical protein